MTVAKQVVVVMVVGLSFIALLTSRRASLRDGWKLEKQPIAQQQPLPPLPTTTTTTTATLTTPSCEDEDDEMFSSGNSSVPWCRNVSEVVPGRFEGGWWKPEGCRLREYAKSDRWKCLKGKKMLFFGDSLGRQVFEAVGGWGNDGSLEEIYEINGFKKATCSDPMTCNLAVRPVEDELDGYHDELHNETTWALGKLWVPGVVNSMPSDPFSLQLLFEADIVVISHGMRGMGNTFCGPLDFYEQLRAHIQYVKGITKPTAQIFVWSLHWLHLDIIPNPTEHFATLCNSPEKIAVFRDIIHQAAACTSTPVIDTVSVTRTFTDDAPDAVHYKLNGVSAKLQILLNHLCPQCPLAPPATRCDIDAAKKRWLAVPEALKPCTPNAAGSSLSRCPYQSVGKK